MIFDTRFEGNGKLFLNQVFAGHRPTHAWFLKIDPVWILGIYICVCVCVGLSVCLSVPEAVNN